MPTTFHPNLIAERSVNVSATPAQVWDALVNPEKIKVYLFGTEVTSDWQAGSPISFRGEYQGHVYHDKGSVVSSKPYQELSYRYWSSMSGLEDMTAHYALVTYRLEDASEGKTRLTWHQQGFKSEEARGHTEQMLEGMLGEVARVAEG